MLKNISIKARLVFVIGLLSAQLIVGAIIGIVNLGTANGRMESLYNDRLVCLGQLDQVIRALTRNQVLLAKSVTADAAKTAVYLSDIQSNRQLVDKVWREYIATKLTDEEKRLADQMDERRKSFVSGALEPAIAAIQAGDKDKAIALVHGQMEELYQPMRDAVNDLIKLQEEEAKREFEASESAYQWVRNTCIVALLLGLALSVWTGIWLVRAISGPLEKAVEVSGRIALGDLTQSIHAKSEDEMGRLLTALGNMNSSLINIVRQVQDSTETISSASGQIASGSMDLSSRTEEQASSLEETASSMEELTSTVKQNEDNARQANALAASASVVASRGGAVVSQVISTMGEINESSRKIVDIISVIDGIAFQTNILALNAAVEAARAGEQGRGFAVVASEVRNLAQRSAGAAKEIKALIANSVDKVAEGSRLVTEAGSTMDEVVLSVKRVTDIMAEIMAATQEQSAGIEQISCAITQMDDVTQQNAALVEEAAAAAGSMQDQARQLSQVVGVFKLNGMAAPAHAPALAQAKKPRLGSSAAGRRQLAV